MPVVKNIKQRTANNSFNTYPIGMNAEFITIPAGTANLYENNVNTDEGMSILKNYIDEQISIAKVNFFVNYTDMNGQVYNLRVYNDNTANGQELRNTLNNLPQNIGNISIEQLYAPNFIYANTLFFNNRNISSINTIDFLNIKTTYHMFGECTNLSIINKLDLGSNIENTSLMFSYCYNLTDIPNFDTSNVTNMWGMFSHCNNLNNISLFNTSNVTNMYSMFWDCNKLTTVPNFNTSNVINMSWMFKECSSLTNIPNFNTSNIINMSCMFEGCHSLINISNFDTRNVTNMSYMFSQCGNLINIPNLNTINVVNMQRMFQICYNLKSTINFNTSNVINMAGAFYHCRNLVNINKLNLNKVTEIFSMIGYCNNLSNSSILNIANSLPHYDNIINANKYNTLDYIGFSNEQISVIINNPYTSNYVENHGWSLPKVSYQLAYTNVNSPDVWINYNLLNQPMTANAKTLRDAFKNKNIDTANIAKLNVINLPGVTNGRYLFANNGSNYNFSKMTNVEHLNMQDLQDASFLFHNDRNLISVSNINCSNMNNCCYIFGDCVNLINISNFNPLKVDDISGMFYNCKNLTTIPNFNTINAKSGFRMFMWCGKLISVPNFDTSNVVGMQDMFYDCASLTTIPNFDTSNVTNMRETFYGCDNLTTVPNFNTSKVTDMGEMFRSCGSLINVPNFDTSNVINISRMFDGCYSLTTVPNFNTSKVTNMYNMFDDCSLLSKQSLDNIAYSLPLYENIEDGGYAKKSPSINQYLKLTNAQINSMSANAKQAAEDKGWMVLPQIRIDYTYINGVNGTNKIYNIDTMTGEQQYQNLYNLFDSQLDVTKIANIKIISSDNKISNMYSLFDSMHQVTNINIQMNTSNVTNMSDLFYDCWSLINVPNLNTIRVTSMTNMFTQCKNIVNIPNFNTSNVTNMYGIFDGCQNLKNISNLNTTKVINMASMFAVCGNLITIPIFNTSNVANMDSMFVFCSSLSQNSLQNIIISIPDRDQITGTTITTNLQYIGLSATQINNLPTYYKQMAADKRWYVEGYEPKNTEMLVGTANALGDITFDSSEEYPMTLTYDDMFGDYCLENTNQGKASTTSSATLTVSEDLLNVFDPSWRFLIYYSSETNCDFIRIYKNNELVYECDGYDGTTSYLDTTFWLEVKARDVLKFEYEKDSSGDRGLDGCKIYISGWKNNKSYEVRYSTVDAPTTYITKFILKEDN